MTDTKLPELPKDFKNRFDRDYSHIVEHWTKAGAEVWFANELKIYKDRLINEYKASLIKKIEKMPTEWIDDDCVGEALSNYLDKDDVLSIIKES